MKPVLVIDACQRSALAVTRSLGRQGVPVITADETESALAGSSRYSSAYHRYPSPSEDTDAFVNAIISLCHEQNITLVLPMTEQTMAILLQHRDRLTGISLPFADSATIDALADKCRLIELAGSLSVPCPESIEIDPATGQPDVEALQYPIVIKPGKSWIVSDDGWLHSTVSHANDPDEARQIISTDPALQLYPYLIQQHVPGHGSGVFAIYDRGKALAFFAHRRIHEKPPRGGVSVICESIEVDEHLLEYSKRLLDAVKWHGVAMVEFRVEGEDAWLMEINTRFWGSLQLSIDAGIDFPWMLYQISRGQQPDKASDYRKGVRLRWLLGDLDWLYLVIKDRQFSVAKKLGAALHFLFIAPFTCKHEINRWSDMGPFRLELKQYLDHILKRN